MSKGPLWRLLERLTVLLCLLALGGCRASASVGTGDEAKAARPAPKPPPTPPKVLRLAASPWAPFTNTDGKPRVAIDLVQDALSRAGFQAETTIVGPGTVTQLLKEGRYDGSPALWKTPERETFLLFSAPYLENRLILVARKGTDVSAQTLSALSGKRVAIVEGYAYGPAVDTAPSPAPVFVRGPDTESNFKKLIAGEVDYVLADALYVHHLFDQYPEKAREALVQGPFQIVKRSLHFAVRRDLPGASDVIARFDRSIAQMRAGNAYHRALQVQWIIIDIDGDGMPELVLAPGSKAGEAPPQSAYHLSSVPPPVGSAGHGNPFMRYFIEGQFYEAWDSIPEYLKVTPSDTNRPGSRIRLRLFEF